MTGNTHRLSVFTTTTPDHFGKVIGKDKDGGITSRPAGEMVRGTVQRLELDGPATFIELLKNTQKNQAITTSIPANGITAAQVVTKKDRVNHPDAISRSKDCMEYPPGLGLVTLDYDPPKGGAVMSREDLFTLLCDVIPAVKQSPVVWSASASSFIYDGETQVRGLAGQRLYLFVLNTLDTPRFMDELSSRCWLAGLGRVEISNSGALLKRDVFDRAMANVGRLDFVGGAVTLNDLHQARPDPIILADGPPLDTETALPSLSAADRAKADAMIASALAEAEPRAVEVRTAWLATHEREAMRKAVDEGKDPQQARQAIARTYAAAQKGTLSGGFIVYVVDEQGNETPTTVDALLKDRPRFHGMKCLDVLDPNHRGREPCAIIYTNQPTPVVWSLNDAGRVWRLVRQPLSLAITAGDRAKLAEQIADELAATETLFLLGGAPTFISPGHTATLTRPLLAYVVGCHIALFRPGKDGKQTPTEPDAALLDIVAALLPMRLKTIIARSTIPLITPAGAVLDTPGLHDGVLVDVKPDDMEPVPMNPTRAQCVDALRRVWAPFTAYRWADPHSRAAVLAAVLTLPQRPLIAAAPGLFLSSPTQASGKSKAVGALAMIARGYAGGAKTWVNNANSEDETRKWAVSAARSGDPVATIDNVTGVFRSSVIATTITEGKLGERLLGGMDHVSPDARISWFASGNGVVMDRDMGSRWLIATIDTGHENPASLSYTFDPVARAAADRMGIVRAALILHRAFHAAGCPRQDAVSSRFSDWGLIRHLVRWLQDSGIAADAGIGALGDPAQSILDGGAQADPEQEGTAQAWQAMHEVFQDRPFTAADLFKLFKQADTGAADPDALLLHEACEGLLGSRARLNSKTFHSLLFNRRNRIAAGLKLTPVPQVGTSRGALWKIGPAPLPPA